MAKLSDNTKQEITDTAVMQSISENMYARDFVVNWKKSHPSDENPTFEDVLKSYKNDLSNGHLKYSKDDLEVIKKEMDILSSFSNNHHANEYVINDVHVFGNNGNEGFSALISCKTSNEVYVAYNGTSGNGWIDNAQGLYLESTKLQGDASDQFDYYCKNYPELLNSKNHVYLTGHSKGGNQAMYATMNSDYSHLIYKCIAYDGQGFSKAAINKWQKNMDEYLQKTSKITLVAGKYDFVNQAGIPIAGTKFYVNYKPWYSIESLKDFIYDKHANYGMFVKGKNGLELDTNCEPGFQDALLRKFFDKYMELSPAEIEASALELMTLLEMSIGDGDNVAADGEIVKPKMAGLLWALYRTSLGDSLITLAGPVMSLFWPEFNDAIAAIIIPLYLDTIRKRNPNYNTQTTDVGSGNSTIMLDVETFNALDASFQIVFNNSFEAAQYAEKAESVRHDLSICGALTKTISKRAADINSINKKVIESFTSVDKENAKAARAIGESYLGSEIYSSVYIPSFIQTSPEKAAQGILYR